MAKINHEVARPLWPYIFPAEKHPALRLPGTTGLGLRPSLACSARLYQKYSKQRHNYIPFEQWKNEYFLRLGLNLYGQKEYKEPSNIHLSFATEVKRQEFLTQFFYLQPIPSFDPLSGKYTLEVPAHSIQFLQQLYYQSPETRVAR